MSNLDAKKQDVSNLIQDKAMTTIDLSTNTINTDQDRFAKDVQESKKSSKNKQKFKLGNKKGKSTKPSADCVITLEPNAGQTIQPFETTTSNVMVVDDIALVKLNENEENKKKKKSAALQFAIVVFLMLLVQVSLAGTPIIIRRFGAGITLEISFVMFIRIVPPTIIIAVITIFIEGKYSLKHSLKDVAMITFMGLCGVFYFSFAAIYISIITNANFTLIYSQMIPIFSTVGAYLFKIEPTPSLKRPWSIVTLVGILLSMVSALIIVAFNFVESSSNNVTTINWVVGTLIALTSLTTYAFYLSYQLKHYILKMDSPFFKKPLAFLSVSSIYSSVLSGVVLVISSAIRWELVKVTVQNPQAWIPIVYLSLVVGVFSMVAIAYSNTKSSPLFVGSTFTIQLPLGLVMASQILGEILNVFQYAMCAGILIGIILVLFGKFYSNKQRAKAMQNKN